MSADSQRRGGQSRSGPIGLGPAAPHARPGGRRRRMRRLWPGYLLGCLLLAGCSLGEHPGERLWVAALGSPAPQPVHRPAGSVPTERPLRLLQVLDGGKGGALDLDFSPSGAALAVAGVDGGVRLWSTATGDLRWSSAVLDGRTGRGIPARRVVVAPGGSIVASGHADGRVVLWSASTGRELRTLPGESGVDGLAFAPDGTQLAVGQADGVVRLWDVAPDAPAREPKVLKAEHRLMLLALAFSPDGRLVASGDTAGAVTLSDAGGGDTIWALEQGVPVVALSFSPDGTTVAVAGWDVTGLREAASGRELRTLPQPGAVQSVVFSPDGATLTAATAGSMVAWRVANGVRLRDHRWPVGGPSVVALSPRARLLASAGRVDDDAVRLWERG
jgi:WD40 repeat protein